jgi:lipopolysaccharide transport system permease protein
MRHLAILATLALNTDHHIRITPKGNSFKTAWRELLKSGSLLRVLSYRDFKIRYTQTYLGFLWSVIQPLAGLSAIFILFYKLAKLEPEGVPYLPFALSGLILWNYFAYVSTQSAAVLINMQSMIKKIYFSKLSLPLSKVLVGAVDFSVGLLLFVALSIYFQTSLGQLWIYIPVLIFTVTAASGLGMLISAFSIRYRDAQQLIPFLIQMLFFLSPVAYSSTLVGNLLPADWQWLYFLNPMSGILDLLRHALFDLPLHPHFYISLLVSLLLFLCGAWFFVRSEKKMADLI